MKRTIFTVKLRNQIGSLAMSMDSAAAVGSMSASESLYMQRELRKILEYIDDKIF